VTTLSCTVQFAANSVMITDAAQLINTVTVTVLMTFIKLTTDECAVGSDVNKATVYKAKLSETNVLCSKARAKNF